MDMFADGASPTDLKKKRNIVVESRDENDFVVQQPPADPYGFWYVTRQKGNVPVALQGKYTTFEYARQAVEQHLHSLNIPKTIRDIKQ